MTIAKMHRAERIPHAWSRIGGLIGRTARAVSDVLYPPRCFVCSTGCPPAPPTLCPDCDRTLTHERAKPSCPTCASTVGPYEVAGGRCRFCRKGTGRVDGMARVGAYEDNLRSLLRAYKFHAREELEPALASWLTEAIDASPWRTRAEAIVPVPTHWRHRIVRRLYPAERLASFASKRLGLPLIPVLRRVRAGSHQVGLPYTARLANVRGAFAVRPEFSLDGARLLVVDDVTTTGATINECAKVLRRAGAVNVYAAVVVKVGWSDPTGQPISDI